MVGKINNNIYYTQHTYCISNLQHIMYTYTIIQRSSPCVVLCYFSLLFV